MIKRDEDEVMTFQSSLTISALLTTANVGTWVGAAAAAETEITTGDLNGKLTSTAAALPGFNAEGGSVFTNVGNAMNQEQFFHVATGNLVYEKPEAKIVQFTALDWCSDLTFSDVNSSSSIGYAGRCVDIFLPGYADILASGAQLSFDFSRVKNYARTAAISAVFVEQQNVFEGQFHANTDDFVIRYWDDGSKTMPAIGWKGHDEGDMRPNAATRSFSHIGDITWMSVEEVAQLFNTSVDEFTPAKFKQIYLDTWIKDHEEEAAEKNPNPLPELDIIEQVKNETNYVDETATTTPVQPDSSAAEDGGSSDVANPVKEDASGSGRQLLSVAARIVSAALMVSSSSASTSTFTFLGLLAASADILPFIAAAEMITEQLLYGKLTSTVTPAPGFNMEGGSVFTNVADAMNHEQLFFIDTVTLVYEKPESEPRQYSGLNWCSDLTFSDVNNSSLIGYAGRCVSIVLPGYADLVSSGAELTFDYSEEYVFRTLGISAVFVEQQNIFEGQFHDDTDMWVARYWDSGSRKTTPMIAWKGHDEGDMRPNAATRSFSHFGDMTWMSVDEVAQLFNTSVDEFTPEKFKQVHLDTWIKDHEDEAAEKNPFPESELEIIEQVKNETNYVDGTATTSTTPVQPDSTAAEDGGGSGRKLVSVAARIVSAALRVFGI